MTEETILAAMKGCCFTLDVIGVPSDLTEDDGSPIDIDLTLRINSTYEMSSVEFSILEDDYFDLLTTLQQARAARDKIYADQEEKRGRAMSYKNTMLFDDGQIQIKREEWAEQTFGGDTIPAHTVYRVGVQNYFCPTMTLDELAKLEDAIAAVREVERVPKTSS